MTNFEYYKDKIMELIDKDYNNAWNEFYNFIGLDPYSACCATDYFGVITWMMSECKEPEVDWTKVAVDTPVLVRNGDDESWCRRHFESYQDGLVHTFSEGRTSWTGDGTAISIWEYAKLAGEEE